MRGAKSASILCPRWTLQRAKQVIKRCESTYNLLQYILLDMDDPNSRDDRLTLTPEFSSHLELRSMQIELEHSCSYVLQYLASFI